MLVWGFDSSLLCILLSPPRVVYILQTPVLIQCGLVSLTVSCGSDEERRKATGGRMLREYLFARYLQSARQCHL